MSFTYTIQPEPIATGGQGSVFFGTRSDGMAVALKIAAPGKQAARALQREIELLRHMRDAGVGGVMPLLDDVMIDGRLTMAMPRYGAHLGDWLKQAILQPDANTLASIFRILGRVARTLNDIHNVYYEGGTVVHRDIKPENLYLDAYQHVFIGDFGGAMAVEELRAVELAMFGTPMWAPLDQLLPGRAIPDTTWDTYATAVLLYAAITGARPAYQADPTELLTPAGQALWVVAKSAVEAEGQARLDAQRRFAVMRKGTTAADLIDVTGRAALVDGDRGAIRAGLTKLGELASVDPAIVKRLDRGLWNLLVRALSPLSHPSPPNRYRDAGELADAIEDLANLIGNTPAPAPVRRASQARLTPKPAPVASASSAPILGGALDDKPVRKTNLSAGPPILATVIGLGILVGLPVVAYFAWPTIQLAFNATKPLPERVGIEAGTAKLDAGVVAVKAFSLDTTEVPVASWSACMEAKVCATKPTPLDEDRPASPLTFADAEALCRFRGGSVPTEAQWRLAHGPARFPWGDEAPVCDQAVALGCFDALQPVGSARQGAADNGAVDLAGHVWEWVRGVDGVPVLVGGGMTSTAKELGAAGRKASPPDTPAVLGGVRCAYTP